jgi:predicted ATPase
MFNALKLSNWRQFESIQIDFHPRLTVLTGQNGAGKTTILNILNRHFGWNINYTSTPKADKRGVISYFSDIWRKLTDTLVGSQETGNENVGEIEYSKGGHATLVVPRQVTQEYSLTINNQQDQPGLHIPSHRSVYRYQPVLQIPTKVVTAQTASQNFSNELANRYAGGGGYLPNYRIKEFLISLALFGPGNIVVAPNPDAWEMFEGFQKILRILLPKDLGFRKIGVRMPEVVLETDSGEFSLDGVSGGVASIIDISWLIYTYSRWQSDIVVTIDEPENHLHPAMQRSLLADLLSAFPNVQFIIATHSPFIVTSSPESNVYVLRFNENKRVSSVFLEDVDKAGTSTEILRDVLGVTVTLPPWAEGRLENIIDRYSETALNREELQKMSDELRGSGLSKRYVDSLTRLLSIKKRDDKT